MPPNNCNRGVRWLAAAFRKADTDAWRLQQRYRPLPHKMELVTQLLYLFAELSKLIYEESTRKPNQVEYRVCLERVSEKEKPASLSEGQLDPVSFESGRRHFGPASDIEKNCDD